MWTIVGIYLGLAMPYCHNGKETTYVSKKDKKTLQQHFPRTSQLLLLIWYKVGFVLNLEHHIFMLFLSL